MTTSLIDKIELLIKREKTTPDRKKDEPPKSSSEILSELFGAFNADPPKIEEIAVKKSKKSKKKHKKDKKKRSHSSSSSSSDDDSDYSHKRKKRKKTKAKKHRSRSASRRRSKSPKRKHDPEPVRVKHEPSIKTEVVKVKREEIKHETTPEPKRRVSIKIEDKTEIDSIPNIDTSLIPMPDSPKEIKLEAGDLRQKLDSKKSECESDKAKGKIQIKNLKFSTVFEETVKKAEEEARRKAEKYEEGEYTDSSSESVKEVVTNSQFPKTSDPGGLKKAAEDKVCEDDKSHRKSKKLESSHKSSKKDRDRSKSKRASSKSRRSRSRSPRRHRHQSPSKSRRSRSRHRSSSRSRRRSRSRPRVYPRHHSPRYRGRDRERGRSRSPTGVKLADSEKKRLLEVARRNAINMLKNGAVPAGAAALPPHTRSQVMAAIQSGGKSVDELTDFCKHLSKKEALGELSSVSSHDDDMSENEDTLAFHHPFLVKEKAPIIMNIRGGAPLPIKTNVLPVANKEELRLQFPVSSGSQHRDSEWRPVSPKKDNMQVAKLNTKQSTSTPAPSPAPAPTAIECASATATTKSAPLALPAPPPAAPVPPANASPAYLKAFATASQLTTTTPLALPAPGPQAYPPGVEPPKIDLAKIVSQKLQMIRKEQEQNELTSTRGVSYFGWSKDPSSLGQFTGSTGAQILTPRELASGTQAWAKKFLKDMKQTVFRATVLR